jgi:hypothetical protein
VCGASVEGLPEGSGRARAFAAHLLDVIARYELDAFFLRDPSRSIGEADKLWLARLPSTWHAADAVAALAEAGALRDWGRLVALYPGW